MTEREMVDMIRGDRKQLAEAKRLRNRRLYNEIAERIAFNKSLSCDGKLDKSRHRELLEAMKFDYATHDNPQE
jgi:hypothetical protein